MCKVPPGTLQGFHSFGPGAEDDAPGSAKTFPDFPCVSQMLGGPSLRLGILVERLCDTPRIGWTGKDTGRLVTWEFPLRIDHGPRLYVCQAPNAFICVSSVAPPKHQMRLYVCHQMRLYVCHQMRLYVCHQMRLYVCHQMRLYVCHQMRLLMQRSSLRSLTFARFARTFF